MDRKSLAQNLMSLTLASALLSSCGGGGGKSSTVNSPTIEPVETPTQEEVPEVRVSPSLSHTIKRRTELSLDLSNLETYKRDINTFTIYARSNTRSFPEGELVCSKFLFDGRMNLFSARFDDRGEFATLNLEILDTDPLKLNFGCYVKYQGGSSNSFSIQLKKSFIVTGETNLNALGVGKNAEIETLLLEENSKLATEGQTVQLSINEIISLGAVISTFSEETLKEILKDVEGDSGGEIDLKVNQAIGTLTFDMRGKNGGIQTLIRPQKEAPKADPALNGTCRKGPVNGREQGCFGKNGRDGYDSEPGYPGYRGGNTGKLKLTIQDARLLNFKTEFNPGRGSSPTPSTKPTEGQPGGLGSYVKWRTGGCSDHAGGQGGGGRMKFQVAKDGREFNQINGVVREISSNGSGLGSVSQELDKSKAFFCGDWSHQFPPGKKGNPGKELPVEKQAKNGDSGSIEPAELNINNKKIIVENNWSSEEL